MPTFLRRITLKDLGVPYTSASAGCWIVSSICTEENTASCTIVNGMTAFEKVDRDQARKGLITLLNKADTGLRMEKLYKDTACHDAHTFTHKHKEYIIWRIRMGDAPRMYFVYGEEKEKELLLIEVALKREDRLNKSKKNSLAQIVKDYLDALDSNQIKRI